MIRGQDSVMPIVVNALLRLREHVKHLEPCRWCGIHHVHRLVDDACVWFRLSGQMIEPLAGMHKAVYGDCVFAAPEEPLDLGWVLPDSPDPPAEVNLIEWSLPE